MKWFPGKNKKQDKPVTEAQQRTQQTEKLTELGTQLNLWRHQQGLSLDELVILTRIPRRILQAIEEGNLTDLPEPIYIQSLIKQFAEALGVNGVEFASNFPIGSQKVVFPQSSWKLRSLVQLRPIHLYLLYIFLILFSVNSLSQMLNKAALQANNNPATSRRVSVLPEEQVTPPDGMRLRPVSDSLSNNTPAVQIGVTLKSSSWIRVVVDGKTDFEGVLPEGTYRSWKAQDQLTVKTNNAGGVLMSVNQQAPKQMGEPGKVEEVSIAARPKL
jgi:cytoskeletal protein RodZ